MVQPDYFAAAALDELLQRQNRTVTEEVVEDELSAITEKMTNLDLNLLVKSQDVNGDDQKENRPASSHHSSTNNPSGALLPRHVQNIFRLGSLHISKNEPSKPQDLVNIKESVDRLIADRQHLHVGLSSHFEALNLQDARETSSVKLPIELWAQIFVACLPTDDFVKPNPREAPLLLCQVCSQWRKIATGTPLLWCTLSIRGSWRRQSWKSSLECWLQRSGNASLFLDVCIPAYMEPTFDNNIKKLITSTAYRWYHLRLSLPDNLLRYMLSNNMPSLYKLEFNSTYPISTLEIQASQAPKLKMVALLTKSLYPQPLSLPWEQLTSISSQCWLNIRQHLEILRKCPRLESYSMCLVHADTPPDARPLLMEKLQRLELVTFIGHSMGPILSHLDLPKLTQLSFSVPHESPACGMVSWPTFSIISLVERSSCPLQKVLLKGVEVTAEGIKEMKKYVPSLISVEFL